MQTSKKSTQYFYKAILSEISNFKKEIFFVFFCIITAKSATFGIPYLLKILIDSISSSNKINTLALSITGIILSYALLSVASVVFNEIKEYLSTKITQTAIANIGENLFQQLISMKLQFHLEIKTGALTRDVDRGLKGIQSITGVLIYSIAPTIIELILVTAYFFISYEPVFLIILFLTLLLYISYSIYTTNIWATSRHNINQSDSDANQKLLESLINVETVKYFNAEKFETNEYKKSLEKYAYASTEAQAVHSKLAIGQQLIISLGLGLALWQAALGVEKGTMSIGDVVLINALLFQVYIPLSFLGIIYKDIKQCAVDVERLGTVINQAIEYKSNHHTLNIKNFDLAESDVEDGLSIEFNNVSFSYTNERKILDSISFSIPKGTTTAIVGKTGSGKSTIAKLVLKIFEIDEGEIKINGISHNQISPKNIRALAGVIPQDISLFNGTIYYNIQYGNQKATYLEIEQAAKAAQIHDFITSLKYGYQTLVGERGLKLSGGERQRIAIARALIKNPKLLVFDEATSALDTKTESAFQLHLLKSTGKQTTLIIAHRLSTIINADNIIVLEHGRIIESGTHEELILRNGTYHMMWNSQNEKIN